MRTPIRHSAFLLFLLAACGSPAVTAPPASPRVPVPPPTTTAADPSPQAARKDPAARAALTDETAAKVDALFADMTHGVRPGCGVGVYRAGEVVFAKGYGLADLEHEIPITDATTFYIASLAKQFTSLRRSRFWSSTGR